MFQLEEGPNMDLFNLFTVNFLFRRAWSWNLMTPSIAATAVIVSVAGKSKSVEYPKFYASAPNRHLTEMMVKPY